MFFLFPRTMHFKKKASHKCSFFPVLAILLLPTSLHESFISVKALIATAAQIALFIYAGHIHTYSLFTREPFLLFKNIQNLMSQFSFLLTSFTNPKHVSDFSPRQSLGYDSNKDKHRSPC